MSTPKTNLENELESETKIKKLSESKSIQVGTTDDQPTFGQSRSYL